MASPHALVRTQGMTFAGLQSGADLAVIEQQGFPDQPASHPTSDQGDPEIPILELCLPGFVETAYRQPVIAMKDRRDTERIEVTQQSGMKAGGTMQPLLLSHHLDPAVRQADARVSLQQDQALFQIGGRQPVIRIQATDITPLARATPAFRAADGPRLGWRRSVMPGSWRASRRSRVEGSSEPSSTRMISKSWKLCRARLSSARLKYLPWLKQGMTTLSRGFCGSHGVACPETCRSAEAEPISRTRWTRSLPFSPSHERKAGGRENSRRCRKWADLTPFTWTPVRFPWRPLAQAARPQAGSRVCSWPHP
ncbi:Uncharacterised protein [Pseudomonas aeruginosa]|nr:Uncharacterised protein [Pseudomonas aeruginosa]